MFDLITIDGKQYIDGRKSHPEAVLCATKVFFYPPKPTYVPPESPILNTLEPGKWIAEPKFDGKRALVLRGAGEEIKAWTREARPIMLPGSVREAVLATFPEWTLGDCEWISKKARLFLLDLVALKGRFLADERLADRKLEAMNLVPKDSYLMGATLPNGGIFTLAPWVPVENGEQLRQYYAERMAAGNEGIVIKHLSSTYRWSPTGCTDVTDWLKLKPVKGLLHDSKGDVIKGSEAR